MVGSTGAEYERKTVYDTNEFDLMTLSKVYTCATVVTITAHNSHAISVPSDAFTIICIDGVYYEFYSSPFEITYTNFKVTDYELSWETNANFTEIKVGSDDPRVIPQTYISLPDYISGNAIHEFTFKGRVLLKEGPSFTVKVISHDLKYFLYDDNLTLETPTLVRDDNIVTIIANGLYNSFEVSIGTHNFTITASNFDLLDYAEYMSGEAFTVSVKAAYNDILYSEAATLSLVYIDGVIYNSGEEPSITGFALKNGKVLLWDKVEGISEYDVQIGEYKKTVSTNEISLYNERNHIKRHTPVVIKAGNLSGVCHINCDYETLSFSIEAVPKLNTPQGFNIEEKMYLTFARVPNDTANSLGMGSSYYLYYNDGYSYETSSPAGASNTVSFNLGYISGWYTNPQVVRIVVHGHSDWASSEAALVTINRLNHDHYEIIY